MFSSFKTFFCPPWDGKYNALYDSTSYSSPRREPSSISLSLSETLTSLLPLRREGAEEIWGKAECDFWEPGSENMDN